nr:uracil-DNA glycosylase [Anaerobiospirillum thomasii]
MCVKTWHDIIGPLKGSESFQNVLHYVAVKRAEGDEIYPPDSAVFNAFKYTAFDKLKVVIVGQDPYHEPGQAMGLAFSVPVGVKTPPSLANIYRELKDDMPGFSVPEHGCLIPWARQGVLLLNSVLTVKSGEANSHHNQGWEDFTDGVIKALNDNCENLVFMLWGNSAKAKCKDVDRERHLVLEAAHPSPLSAYRGFLGCRHFSKANTYLHEHGKTVINWQLPLYLDGSETL